MNKLPVIMKPLLKFGAVGRGLKLEDVSRGKKMYFEQHLCCLLDCKAFGGSRVKTRRRISRQENVF